MTTTNTHARPFILDSKTREYRPATEAEIERSHQALFARLSESQSQANPASAIAQALRALPTKAASRAVEPEQEAVTVTALSLADLETANAETAGLSEIVQGFFPARSVNLLAGDSGLGKSPLICQLAVCVAAGVPFLGQAVKQGTVIIADFENDAALAGMLRNVAKAVNANPADFMSRLHILQRPSQKAVLKAAKELGAALVIIDSLRGFDSQAEGKSDTAGALIARLQEHDGCWI